jgi:hypothetical protein
MWEEFKERAIGAATIIITIGVFVGWFFDFPPAHSYHLSVFNCYSKPCEWIEDRGVYHKYAECEKMGKQLLDEIVLVKEYKCEE